MELAKVQRNAIFHSIAEGKLNPADCVLNEEGSDGISVLHSPTGSRIWIGFTIPPSGRPRGVRPAIIEPPVEISSITYQMKLGDDPRLAEREIRNWEAMLAAIQEWAEAVVEWINMPDLWNMKFDWELLRISGAEIIGSTPFTREETAEISEQLAAVKEEIRRTYSLTNEQLALVEARIDEAEDASRRICRKDWALLFMGAIFSLILADVVTPEIAQHILMMVVHGLGHLFSGEKRPISG